MALLVTEDGTTWTELMRWDDSGSLSNTGESISELALTGYGADVKFAFYGFSDTSNEDNNFYIDNFQITTTTLGVAKNSIENFSLFPTLVKDEISFTSQEVVDTFMVYNLLGQQVFSKKINAKTAALNLTVLKKGMYLVKVTSGNSTGTYKIIKEILFFKISYYKRKPKGLRFFYAIFTIKFNFHTWVFLRRLTTYLQHQKNLI